MQEEIRTTVRAVAKRFSAHNSTQLAASISYYALLSIFPAAIVLTAIAAAFIGDADAKREVVDFLFDELPVSATDGRGDLETLVDGVTSNAAAVGIVGLVTLVISASALMTAVRNSISIAFEITQGRSFLRGKALDVLLILGIGVLGALSFGGTLAINLLEGAKDDLGAFGDAISGVLGFITGLLPIASTAAVFAVLLMVVPARPVSAKQVWPAVAVGTAGFELAKRGFSLYLDSFANYAAVYGSLGAVVAFMVFIYISALVLLVAAELAAIRAEKLDSGPDAALS